MTQNLKLLNRDDVVSFLLTKPIGTVVLRESSPSALQANPNAVVTASYLVPIHTILTQKQLNEQSIEDIIFKSHKIKPNVLLTNIDSSNSSSASSSNSSSSVQGGRHRTRRSKRSKKYTKKNRY